MNANALNANVAYMVASLLGCRDKMKRAQSGTA